MDKWSYINLISQRGSHYGYDGGVYDLLVWCNKENTKSIAVEEAKEFWENWPHLVPQNESRTAAAEIA